MGSSEWYRKKAENRPAGVCSRYPNCKNPVDGTFRLCAKHRQASRAAKRKMKARVKPETECRVLECRNPARPGLTQCDRCAKRGAKYSRTTKAKEKRAQRRREIKLEVMSAYGGGCRCCGRSELAFLTIDHVERHSGKTPRSGTALYLWLKRNSYPEGFRVLCMNCNFSLGKFGFCQHSDLIQPLPVRQVLPATKRQQEYQRQRNQKEKREAFEAYGGAVCKCCGEDVFECLSIDHIANDGAAHRMQLKGTPIYRWLRQQEFPPGYQVLCLNCNMSKRDNGGHCVHQGGQHGH